MPLRRKTRSSVRTTGSNDSTKEESHTSPTSNGGRTHPKEMYAPDRATRSRTSSEDLIILELPKSSRLKKPNSQAKGSKLSKGDAKSKKVDNSLDGLNSASASSKQVNNVNSSGGTPSHLNDSTPGVSSRTRRRSGRLSGDTVEKEPRKISPQTSEQAVARSERRRKRSGNDVESDSPSSGVDSKNVKSDGLRHSSRRLSSTEDKSPAGKSDNTRDKKTTSNNKRLDPDADGNFKVPSVTNKLKPSEPLDVAIHDSPRASRRHTSGKPAASIDKVLSVDVDVTSHDSLPTRTSPRRPKVSPRSADRRSQKESDKVSSTQNAASKDAPVSPRTRSVAAAAAATALPKQEPENQDAQSKSSTSDSSRKRRPSGNQSLEADTVAVHSTRKRRRTGSVCRDLSSEFDTNKSGNDESKAKEPSDKDEKVDNTELALDNKNEKDEDNSSDVLNALNLQPLQAEDGTSSSSKLRRKGSSTPTNSPRKSRAKSPARSPARRGLRSSGQVPGVSLEPVKTEECMQTDNLGEVKESSAEPIDGSAIEKETSQRTEEETSQKTEEETLQRTEEETLQRTEEETLQRTEEEQSETLQVVEDIQDSKTIIESFEEFQGEGWYEDVEDTELFFFESDHVALKGNRDYRMMLRTLATLEAQRKQAVQDLDLLVDKKKEALQNAVLFAQKLQKREDVGLPNPQKVVTLPEIEWQKYLGAAEAIEMAGFKHQTRGAKIASSKHTSSSVGPSSSTSISAVTQLTQKVTASQSPVQQHQPSTSAKSDLLIDLSDKKELSTVRGRLADPNKPASFNQLWTVEEQRKLEELLVKFPMEEVEARRWEKIAKALGNRTAQQVASRVQKYFIKLTKAGLPVPGRIPNMTYYTNRKRGDKRMHPFTKPLYQPSTFLQSIRPPVYMTEEDENIGWSGFMPGQDDDDDDVISDDESIPVELRNTEEYQELLRLKKMKKDKTRQQSLMCHQGYKCDGCNMEPIIGVRWHCEDCPAHLSTDLCQACVDCDFCSPDHSSSHQMEPIQYSYGGPSFVDTDYTRFTPSTGDYNYLDPNYNPSALPT